MDYFMGILRNIFRREPGDARNIESLERRKEEFYSNYPKNGVALPDEGSRGVNYEQSHMTSE